MQMGEDIPKGTYVRVKSIEDLKALYETGEGPFTVENWKQYYVDGEHSAVAGKMGIVQYKYESHSPAQVEVGKDRFPYELNIGNGHNFHARYAPEELELVEMKLSDIAVDVMGAEVKVAVKHPLEYEDEKVMYLATRKLIASLNQFYPYKKEYEFHA